MKYLPYYKTFSKKLYLKVIFPILLIALSTILFFSKSTFSPKHIRNNAKQDFDAFTDSVFKEQLSSDALSSHFYLSNPKQYGISEIPCTLGEYSYDSMKQSQAYYIQKIDSLKKYSRNKLQTTQKITYDILLQYFREQLDFADLCLCSEVLSPTTGIQAQLPILFSEYSFNCHSDVENYLSLLSDIKNYYAQICEFQKVKAKNNCFISDFCCDDIISQCRDFMNNNDVSQNILTMTFNSKINNADFLTDAQRSSFIAQNKVIIENSVLPGYQLLINTLGALKENGYCKNSNGLCHLKNGSDYYEYIVRNYTGCSQSVFELKADIQKNLMSDMRTMNSILTSNPDLESKFYSNIKKNDSPESILSDLSQKYKNDFPAISEINYRVKTVDKSLENHLSPAFYLAPPIDDNLNIIYINHGKNSSNQDLYTTLAHEGIPGHMYQSCFFSQTKPSPIRYLVNYGGYTEGWATYAEFMSYFYEYSDKQLALALSCSASYSLALYSLCDIGVNYEGWTLEETKDFLANYNMNDENVCKNIFQAVVEEPANYLQYYVGYIEILKLKDRVQKKFGVDFNLKKFHKAFLTIGPASFDVIGKWIFHEYTK